MLASLFLVLPAGCAALVPALTARPAVAARPAIASAGAAVRSLTPPCMAVPLTGNTLQAALKFRCDTTGAGYAIYWVKVKDEFRAVGSHVNGGAGNFVEASKTLVLDANGNGPISSVKSTGKPLLVTDIKASTINQKRKELAFMYGVTQVALIPFEDGVLEVGNTRDKPQWSEVPAAPTIPKGPLREAFEVQGALYAMYWEKKGPGNKFHVVGDYENPRDKAMRQRTRSDGESFVTHSRTLEIDADGDGPIATAMRANKDVFVAFGEDGAMIAEDESCASMKRADKAYEFNIQNIHFMPVNDPLRPGVLEYGVDATAQLNEVTMQATLELQTEANRAGYAIYWKQEGSTARVEDTFTGEFYRRELDGKGTKLSYADISTTTKFELMGQSPVAEVLSTGKPVYVPDMTQCTTDIRAGVARDYLITSVAFVPVLGGVIEYGSTVERPWASEKDAFTQNIPNEEIEKALRAGATYLIYWQRDEAKDQYSIVADYELPANQLSKQLAAGGTSYLLESAKIAKPSIDGLGPVSTCGKSGAVVVVPDTQNFPSFLRRDLAKEWGVGKVQFTPLETGVLEFGTVTKDKRETTRGSEYQEATRPYRRSVFMHGDWVEHRSTERFFKSMSTLLTSGVGRARYKEVLIGVTSAVALNVYNTIAGGYTDFALVKHGALIPHLPVLSLPLSIFSLTAPSLGLLLVFRTNAAYGRWDNARKVWGDIINKCRTLVRQANTFCLDDRYPGYGNFRDYRRRIAAQTSAFTRCLRCFLRGPEDEENLRIELKALGFTAKEVNGYMKAANKQVYALQVLGETIRHYGMDGRDRANMDNILTALCDDVGACERIFKTPIPLVYTRHTSRFVGFWLALLPLAVWGIDSSWNHLASIPSVGLTIFFLLGIEELGLQIEEPFGILPMEAFCDGSIGAALQEMVLAEDQARAMQKAVAMEMTGSVKADKITANRAAAMAGAAAEMEMTSTVASQATAAALADAPGAVTPTKTAETPKTFTKWVAPPAWRKEPVNK